MVDRTPFTDEPLEQAVIGAALIDADAYNLIAGITVADHFWNPQLRLYWTAIADLRRQGKTPSVVTVRAELPAHHVAAAGESTVAMLNECIDRAEPIYSVEQAAAKLLQLYAARSLFYRAKSLVQSAYETEPDEFMAAAAALSNGVDVQPGRRIETAWEVAQRLIRDSNSAANSTVTATRFIPFDRATGGLTNSMTIIAGRPSMGKSAMAHQVMLDVAKQRIGAVLYCCIETSNDETAKRIVVNMAEVDYAAAFRNRLDQDQSNRYVGAVEQFATLPIHMLDIASLTPTRIRAEAVKLQSSPEGLALVVVDYIQSVKPDRVGRDMRGDVTSVALALRDLARDLNVPVIAVAQLNRESELKKRRPCMADLGESGALEQAASAVVFPFRPSKFGITDDNNVPYPDDYAEIIVGKNRNGTDGIVRLRWNGGMVKFVGGE